MPEPTVRPGQVWADNDRRAKGRTLRVDAIDGDKAVCTILTNSDAAQSNLDRGDPWTVDMRGKTTRVALRRLRPSSTGYRFVQEGDRTDG